MRDELQRVLAAVREMAAEQLPELLGELEVIRATATMRMMAPAPAQAADERVDAKQAAARLGVSVDYLYEHKEEYPFFSREGRKLLFSNAGITTWIKQQNNLTARKQGRRL